MSGETEAELEQMRAWASPSPGLLVMASFRVADCCCWAWGKEVKDIGSPRPSLLGHRDTPSTLPCLLWTCPAHPTHPAFYSGEIRGSRTPRLPGGEGKEGWQTQALIGGGCTRSRHQLGEPQPVPGPVAGLAPSLELPAYPRRGQTPSHTLKLDLIPGPGNTSLGGRMEPQRGKGPGHGRTAPF